MDAPALYIVATPIGDIEDITLRALRILRTADAVIAEDARVAKALLAHYEIVVPIIRYDSRRAADVLEEVEAQWREGKSIALVCDAGTPAIADPGVRVIQRAHRLGVRVTIAPGANAAIAALAVSGLACGQFTFLGFPPRSKNDATLFFTELRRERRTLVLYESFSYLSSTLEKLREALGAERPVVLARNLTKPDETLLRGTLGQAAEQAKARRRKGEYVIVVERREPLSL